MAPALIEGATRSFRQRLYCIIMQAGEILSSGSTHTSPSHPDKNSSGAPAFHRRLPGSEQRDADLLSLEKSCWESDQLYQNTPAHAWYILILTFILPRFYTSSTVPLKLPCFTDVLSASPGNKRSKWWYVFEKSSLWWPFHKESYQQGLQPPANPPTAILRMPQIQLSSAPFFILF